MFPVLMESMSKRDVSRHCLEMTMIDKNISSNCVDTSRHHLDM